MNRTRVLAFALAAVCSIASAKPYLPAELVKLQPPDITDTDLSRFGETLAADGGTLLVGAPGKDALRGAVYVYQRRSATVWQMTAKIVEPGGTPQIQFGDRLDLSGNTAIIRGGSVFHVFVRSGSAWTREAALQLSDGSELDAAIDGDRVILVQRRTGFAFAYRRSNGVWTRQAQLRPDVNAPRFYTVAMSDGVAVLGAPTGFTPFFDLGGGSVYVYRLHATAGERDAWTREIRLQPQGRFGFSSGFGLTLDVSRNRVVVGSEFEANNKGAAYVFAIHSDGFWRQTARLGATSVPNCAYGAEVSIHYDRLAAASPCTSSVELFQRESGAETWIRRDRTVNAGLRNELSDCGAFAGSGNAVYVLPSATCAPPITP